MYVLLATTISYAENPNQDGYKSIQTYFPTLFLDLPGWQLKNTTFFCILLKMHQ